MSAARLGLILLALGCADPTATSPRPAAIVGQQPQNNQYSIDGAHNTVYVRLVQVRSEGGEPVHAFMRRVFESADSVGARRLVIDLRSFAGGDARLLVPLLKGILARDRFVQHGGLFVIVGSNAFSPSQNAATLLQRYAHPIFVGQPPASGPIT